MTTPDEDRLWEEAHIEASERDSPNSPDFDRLHERIYERMLADHAAREAVYKYFDAWPIRAPVDDYGNELHWTYIPRSFHMGTQGWCHTNLEAAFDNVTN